MATVEGDLLLQNLLMDDNDLFIMEPELTLPAFSIEVEVIILDAELRLPGIFIEVESGAGAGVEGDLVLSNVSIEVDTGIGVLCNAEFKLPTIRVEVETYIQNLVDGELTLPNISIFCETGHACTIDAELTLPNILLSVEAQAAIAATFETWVINAATFAHAQYDNYSFNSYIELNGVCYGLNSAGIYSLTGASDSGTAIAASAKWGVVNLGSEEKKVLDGGYLNCRQASALQVGLSTEEGTRYTYTATDHGKAGLHAERFKSGKGLKGTVFQPDIANVAGGDFDVMQVDLLVNKCQRRAG